MESKRDIGTGQKIVFFLITAVLLFILVEGVLSILLYQKTGAEKIASIETLKKLKNMIMNRPLQLDVRNHKLVRPDSADVVNEKIAHETVASNKFIYRSWVEYSNKDFEGNYMNMSNAIRKSNPESYINPSSTDTVDIYFFGGSTMFGFNLLDNETIPSEFVQLYKKNCPGGKSIRVVNLGTPTFYSYQELILLSDLIYSGHKPKILVFLDGLNDFWFATATYHQQSYFSYIFRQVFNRGLRSKGEFHFIDTADAMFKNPGYIPVREYNNALVGNYIKNMENIRMMADLVQAKAFFFCQPSPFYNYPNQQKDPMCFKDTLTRFNDIYPMLEKKADSIQNFTFLGNMLENEEGYPFVDGLHYSPTFIKKITEQIFIKVQGELERGQLGVGNQQSVVSQNLKGEIKR